MFVGREAELSSLKRSLERTAAGRGGFVALLGEAGAGKTTLLRRAQEEASALGLTVLHGASPPSATAIAFGTLAQVLRSWSRTHELPRQRLAPYAPGLAHVLPELGFAPDSPDLTEDQRRLLVLEGSLQLLRAAAGARGAVVILDDLHNADMETKLFVQVAAEAIARERVLVVAAIRTPEGRRTETDIRALERRGVATIIEVPALARSEVRVLAREILRHDVEDALLDDVITRTDGVPLLVEELLADHRLPATFELARERLARIGADASRVIFAASVLRRFDHELLARMTDVSDVSPALRAAVDAGLLVADPEIAFRHALLAEAVAHQLLPDERRALHRRALEILPPDAREERARHAEAIGEADVAAALLVDAGRESLARHAPASAEEQLRRALGLAQSEALADRARDALAETLSAIGRHQEALRLDEELLARGGGSPQRLQRMARNAVHAGRLEEADALIARAEAAGAPPAPLRALSALTALWRGDLAIAIAMGTEAEALADGDALTLCAALDVVGRASDAQGRREDAQRAFAQWAEIANGAGLRLSRVQALMETANLDFLHLGDPRALRQVRVLARDASAFTTLVLADISLAWCVAVRGELPEAREAASEAVDTCRRLGLELLPHALIADAFLRSLEGTESHEPILRQAEDLAPDDHDVIVGAAEVRADAAVRAGRYGDVLTTSEHAMEVHRSVASSVPTPIAYYRVLATIAAGRGPEAALEDARRSATNRIVFAPFLLAAVEAIAARDTDGVDRALTNAIGASHLDAMLRVAAAELLGGPRGTVWLREALAYYETQERAGDAARVRRLLRARGERVARARRAPTAMPQSLRDRGVSSREAEVLLLVADGLSNQEIADRLSLSVRTIESHVSALLAKLGVTNRAALVSAGLRGVHS